MNKILVILFICLSHLTTISGQQEDNKWMIGSCSIGNPDTVNFGNMLVEFTADSFSIQSMCIDYGGQHNNTCISSKSGELLYYSNGSRIYHSDYGIVPGADNLQPDFPILYPSPNATLLLPAPGDTALTYLIQSDVLSFFDGNGQLQNTSKDIRYNLLRRFGNSSDSEVIESQVLINQDTLELGMLTATQHGNGRDWWIIAKGYDNASFYIFLLDPTGIHLHDLQTVGSAIVPGFGQAKFSPDGSWYGIYSQGGGYPPFTDWRWDLYQFDRCAGQLSNHIPYISNEDGVPGGIAFSPNSSLLYVSVWDHILQYDLSSTDIIGSVDTVAIYDGFEDQFQNFIIPTRFYHMQLTPNNKIFICVPNISSRHYHVIHNPDVIGSNCFVDQHGIALPKFYNFNIPNLPHFRSGPLDGSVCDSLSIASNSITVKDANAIKLFPNPASNTISLTIPHSILPNTILNIIDARGQLAKSIEITSNTTNINILDLPNGIYFCSLYNSRQYFWSGNFLKL